ncbi:hypothetical protein PVK06_018102 [Gossypium arboreum]|uniref:Transposase n=1 Tax=Gossypium arboreum TaxID=29729 RepID=A0ABR0Q588_GOSAR|nr:hypothetical protein PVK06_018102 [Gossypium arboreum]
MTRGNEQAGKTYNRGGGCFGNAPLKELVKECKVTVKKSKRKDYKPAVSLSYLYSTTH